jgi:hypothetical protein
MRRSDLVQHKEKDKGATTRTSQIVFGERQHLLRVLDSLEGTELPVVRAQQERRSLEELIHARTRELNQINTAWDEKIGLVLSADAKPEMLEMVTGPETDYLLRLIMSIRVPTQKHCKARRHPTPSAKRGAPSQRRHHAYLPEQRSQSTTLVFGSFQSQHAAHCSVDSERLKRQAKIITPSANEIWAQKTARTEAGRYPCKPSNYTRMNSAFPDELTLRSPFALPPAFFAKCFRRRPNLRTLVLPVFGIASSRRLQPRL